MENVFNYPQIHFCYNSRMKKLLITVVVAGVVGIATAVEVSGKMSGAMLISGSERSYVLDADGKIIWERKGCGNIHLSGVSDGWVYYSNGTLMRTSIKDGKTECFYKALNNDGIYGFQILPNGNIVIAENSSDYITELAAGTTNAVVKFKGDPCDAAGKTPSDSHHHYRMIEKTNAGTYLVCCSGANFVREYDATGKLLWEQKTPILPFDAIRRKNGNTLISHLTAITEYTPDHKIVWQFKCDDLPTLQLANLCGIHELANGNLVVGTYANGSKDGKRTTAFEITRDKKVVWSYASKADHNMMTVVPINALLFKSK